MGDGGVACVPSQHIMDKFSICSNTNGNTKLNSSSKSTIKLAKVKPKMKPKKDKNSSKDSGSLNSEILEKSCNGDASHDDTNEEVEEGELGTLPFEHGEFVSEKPLRRFEIKSEIDKGEVIPNKWRKVGGELEKNNWRTSKDDLEKGEFVPDRWFRNDSTDRANEFDYLKARRYDSAKERGGRKSDHERTSPYAKERAWRANRESESTSTSRREKDWKADREWSPPSAIEKGFKGDLQHGWVPTSTGKYSNGKELGKSAGSNQHSRKASSGYEAEKTQKISSKIVGDEGLLKSDSSNSKGHLRDYSISNRIKRHAIHSDGSDRKYHVDYDEYSSSKNRKLSDDATRSGFSSDQYSGRSGERQYKPPASASSRSLPSERYSSRYLESSRATLDRHNGSPHRSDRSPRSRARNHDHRARSPAHHTTPSYDRGHPFNRSRSPYEHKRHNSRSRSPYDHKRHNSSRHRSPSCVERSPYDHARNCDGRDWTPTFLERSPRNLHRHSDHGEANRKGGMVEKQTNHCGGEGQEGKQNLMTAKESSDGGNVDDKSFTDKISSNLCHHDDLSQSSALKSTEFSQGNGVAEEPASMEEDMDICDTPPHVPQAASDAVAGKWYYLDHFGVERGPAKLSELNTLVEEGYLVSDHLIKHLDSDRWVTVEKAVSPLVTTNSYSVDTVTGLACPPEAPGNLLSDSRIEVCSDEEMLAPSSHSILCSEDNSAASNTVEDFRIDNRVGALLEGVTLIPGNEVDILAEVLQMTVEHGEWDLWRTMEGYARHEQSVDKHFEGRGAGEWSSGSELNETAETTVTILAPLEKDNALNSSEIDEIFSGQWACRGCDWKRNDEAAQDRTWKKNEEAAQDKTWKRKLVLNDGYPLCQMPKSGYEDPRWEKKDELYFPSQSRRLDLPLWAFTSPDELNDASGMSQAAQAKSALARLVRGAMLPVIRINACVVKDHGSFVSEARVKVRGKERLPSRSLRTHSTTGDTRRSSKDGNWEIPHEQELQDLRNTDAWFDVPKDHVCKVDELKLHLGDWYFLDGTGHERGPRSFSDLQLMADQGIIQKHISVFRKQDNMWVPLNGISELCGMSEHDNNSTEACGGKLKESQGTSTSLHNLHPQFVGYTRGKLHELVMKSYKSREFAAAINEVLDPWINARQPKKEIEQHIYHSDYLHPSKRARMNEIGKEYEMEEDVQTIQNDVCEFDDVFGEVTFKRLDGYPEDVKGSWDLLDGHVLARVFHFLRADIKSLFYAALTCKHWRSVVKCYKHMTRQVDFCALAPNCPDSVILKIMSDYNKEKITSLQLRGCTSITSGMLEELVQSFPFLSTIDIRGCTQFEDLVHKFPNINWVRTWGPHLKIRSLNHLIESASASNQTEDSSGLKEYLESSDKRDSAHQLFRRSLYKRSKLFDARKSSSILSRDAQLRHLAIKKIGNGYKRVEEYIAKGLQDIMSKNTFEFFEPKVAKIEERMRNGHYARRGLNIVKEDIRRMCREAIKHKNRGDARDMNRIVALFIQLATCLDKGSKLTYSRDEMMKSWKDESPPGFSSASSKYKKNLNKVSERKHLYRSDGSLMNGNFYTGDFASDREIRRRLSKLNNKSLESGSDTSDDFDKSSGGSIGDSASTASDTESDFESPSDGAVSESRGESYFIHDDGFDSCSDDREWGARMTKASLVPPVTRKYEVIDHYVIVSDEEEVRRKMQVSLPEDYAEKLNAQRNGTEESDMEIPEVKDYKPRKSLGDEVIEQEVYGIDPYTHNLLLDSMPEESGWSLLEKHIFIEEVLLRTLNKKVRDFTGSGNTPMKYPLKPVFEEIFDTAEENYDRRTMELCQFIMKAIDSRPVDNYVAYRKGLGVVCNKEGGFSEDDFVVEFLGEVYPTWKWFEKQDGIRALQKNNNDPVPEFYNIYLERPKGDADGYDLVVVDAMHKANYASRICHSCRPNCEAKVTAVDGQYQIGIYSVRPIAFGEEITFDYNSVTESKEEYEASVCLCGNQVCRGSFLNLTGEGAFQKVLKEHHGLLHRHLLLLEACELNSVSEEDYIDLGKAGLGSCLLGGLPDWLIAYSARLVRYINLERTKLPEEILRHNIEEKKKYLAEIHLEVEKSDAEIQAEGVYNQRLQNLALTIDKVKYVLRCVFGDPKKAPPPLERLSPEAAVSYLWKGDGSFVEELVQCMAPHMEDAALRDLKAKIHSHDPSGSDDTVAKLRKSLLWLRDEVRNLTCTYKSRHDAAADLIHTYAYTKCFFRIREYKRITSPPVYITPLDLGPKYAEKLGSGVHEYCKTYGERYCLGQLMFWHSQNAEPDATLAKASKGCLSLPDVGSFYAKVQKPSRQLVYGPRTVKFMLARMEKQPQRPWPKDRIWSFKNSPKFFGTPMLDAVLNNAPLNREMIHWLKHRPPIYHTRCDR